MALSQSFLSVNRILFWDVTKTVCHVACSTCLGTSRRNPWRNLEDIAGWISHLASVCRSKRSARKTYFWLPPSRWSTISLWSWRPSSHQIYDSCETNYITESWQHKIRRTPFEDNNIYDIEYSVTISTYSNFLRLLISFDTSSANRWNQAWESALKMLELEKRAFRDSRVKNPNPKLVFILWKSCFSRQVPLSANSRVFLAKKC